MKKIASTSIKISISAAIIAAIFMRMDAGEIQKMVRLFRPEVWVAAIALIFLQILCISYRYGLLLSNDKINYDSALRITLASLLANYAFITSVGGIVVKIAAPMKYGVSWVTAATATALDRFATIGALAILSVPFLPFLSDALFYNTTLIAYGVIFVVAAAVAVAVANPKILYIHEKLEMCIRHLRGLTATALAKITFASIAAQASYFIAVYVLTASTGIGFSPLYFMAIMPAVALASSLPIGYGGWGVREGAFVFGLGLVNISTEAALAVSIQIGLICMLSALLMGAPVLLTKQKNQQP